MTSASVVLCVSKFLNLKDLTFLFVGIILAILTGGGLVHLTFCVGWILEILISVDNRSTEFRTQMFPFLAYYSFTAFVSGIISFFQFICFRHVALKLGRRFRRRYFKLLLLQSPDFFPNIKNKAMNEKFEADVQKLQQSFTDSAPTIVTILTQFLSSFGMSFYLSKQLSSPISLLGSIVFLFIFILTFFTLKLNQSEQLINQESRKAIIISTTFSEWCNSLFSNGIKKSIIISLISGSLWLFMFGGMGIGAWYGNWLIDSKDLLYPGYIFVISCSIIPACYRFGQIPLIWNNFLSVKLAPRHLRRRHLRRDICARQLRLRQMRRDICARQMRRRQMRRDISADDICAHKKTFAPIK